MDCKKILRFAFLFIVYQICVVIGQMTAGKEFVAFHQMLQGLFLTGVDYPQAKQSCQSQDQQLAIFSTAELSMTARQDFTKILKNGIVFFLFSVFIIFTKYFFTIYLCINSDIVSLY